MRYNHSLGYLMKRKQNIERMRELAEKRKTREEIAEAIGLSYDTICKLALNNKIEIERKEGSGRKKSNDIYYIMQQLKEGRRLWSVAVELGVSGVSLYCMLTKERADIYQPCLSELEIQTLQNSIQTMDKRTRKVVEGVLEGKSSFVLGREIGMTREGAIQYITGLGLYNEWRARRESIRKTRVYKRIF